MQESAPRWAVCAKKAMDRLRELSYWWYDRQDPDTGIGFEDDDTESILVAAPTLILCQDDSRAREALCVLCEQMWRQWGMDGEKEVGYPTNIDTGDVEHAAEPISFSQPNGMLAEPGDPVYVERCLISARNMEDWTSVNAAGHRHFKAFYFGAGGVKDVKYYDCDIPMNARAVIPGVYAAWYSRNPVIVRYLREYADAWVDHAMESSYGKPVGVVPSEIRFADDKVGGYSGRWDQIAGYKQFDWSAYHRSSYNMYYFLISMHLLTGNERYLVPVRETIKYLAAEYSLRDASDYGIMYRNFTGRTDLDELFAPLAADDPVWRWFLKGDKDALADWCSSFAEDLESTMAARTVDLDLRDPCANYKTCVNDSVLRLMYTGGLGYQVGAYPFVQVSWKDVDENFVALVTSGDKEHVSVLAYSFADKERMARMLVWNLPPGDYEVLQGPEYADGSPVDRLHVRLTRWGTVPVRLEPGKVRKIHVHRLNDFENQPEALPDLALSATEVLASKSNPVHGDYLRLNTTVHNIGSSTAQNVIIEAREVPSGDLIIRKQLGNIDAPLALIPSRVKISFPWQVGSTAEGIEIAVFQEPSSREITLSNNRVMIKLSQLRDRKRVPKVRIHRDPPPPEKPLEIVALRRAVELAPDWCAEDADWNRAPIATLRHRMYSDSDVVSNPTEIRALYDDVALYLLFLCRDPDPSSLKAQLTTRDDRVWDDESIEITLDPYHDHKFYYHFAVNSLGTIYDAEMISPFWDGEWTAKVSTDRQGWKVQVTLPFKTLGICPKSGATIGINFIRTNYADFDRGDRQTSIWQKVPGWTLRPAYFGHLRFG